MIDHHDAIVLAYQNADQCLQLTERLHRRDHALVTARGNATGLLSTIQEYREPYKKMKTPSCSGRVAYADSIVSPTHPWGSLSDYKKEGATTLTSQLEAGLQSAFAPQHTAKAGLYPLQLPTVSIHHPPCYLTVYLCLVRTRCASNSCSPRPFSPAFSPHSRSPAPICRRDRA